MKDKKILIIGLAVGGYFLWKQQKELEAATRARQYLYSNPQPPVESQAWQIWATGLINIAGSIAELFKPGGPFSQWSQQDKENFEQAVLQNCTPGGGGFGIPGVC
ncbi:MAG: hypothetical protein AAGI23_09455 [Bacteroidota bacterium]